MNYRLRRVASIDAPPILDCAQDPIPASSDLPRQIVASLAATAVKVSVTNATNRFIGLYAGASGEEVEMWHFGADKGEEWFLIEKGTRLSIRSMDADAIQQGGVSVQFFGLR